VTPQTRLADLVDANEFWIEALIPYEKLGWIDIPGINAEQGSPVKIYQSADKMHAWTGTVFRLSKEIEERGRMAKILISMKNPFRVERGTIPILLNTYVYLDIQGRMLKNVFKIPRNTLRDNQTLWEADSEDKLAITPVKVVWKDESVVYIQASVPSIELITTDLSLPVAGMPVSRFNSSHKNENGPLDRETDSS